MAGEYRLSWLLPLIDQDRQARREIRRLERLIGEFLDQHSAVESSRPRISR